MFKMSNNWQLLPLKPNLGNSYIKRVMFDYHGHAGHRFRGQEVRGPTEPEHLFEVTVNSDTADLIVIYV